MSYSISAKLINPYQPIYDCPIQGYYVDAEKFMDLLYANGETYEDFDGFGGGGMYVRMDPEVVDALMPAVALIGGPNVSLFLEWAQWLKEHPDVWLEGYH